MNEAPKSSETLWEWRAFSKTFQKSLINMIRVLPVKFDRPTKMTDNYVWTPNCNLNIKLREQDLKIKELLDLNLVTWKIPKVLAHMLSYGLQRSIAFQFLHF
jgi:hypothetical protein